MCLKIWMLIMPTNVSVYITQDDSMKDYPAYQMLLVVFITFMNMNWVSSDSTKNLLVKFREDMNQFLLVNKMNVQWECAYLREYGIWIL